MEKPEFTTNVRLNDDAASASQAETMIATGPDGLVLVGWVDGRYGLNCGYTSSMDGGMTWSENLLLAPESGGITGDTTVAIGGDGTLYAGCQDYGTSQVRLMTSIDKGETWSDPQSIQDSPDKPWLGASPSDGTLFVSWLGNDAGVKRSTDRGATWDPIHELGFLSHGTAIMVGSTGVVHVAFDPVGGEMRYARSKDLGETWEGTRTIAEDTGSFCFGCQPRQHPITGGAADPTGQYVAVTWSSRMPDGDGDDDVWLIYSSDAGDTWTSPVRVNDNSEPSRQFQSWVAVDSSGQVHVVWTDARDGQNDTYYARSADPTQGFEPSIKVNDASGSGFAGFLDYKGIAIQGNDVLVVWQDTRAMHGDIYFAKAPGAACPP